MVCTLEMRTHAYLSSETSVSFGKLASLNLFSFPTDFPLIGIGLGGIRVRLDTNGRAPPCLGG